MTTSQALSRVIVELNGARLVYPQKMADQIIANNPEAKIIGPYSLGERAVSPNVQPPIPEPVTEPEPDPDAEADDEEADEDEADDEPEQVIPNLSSMTVIQLRDYAYDNGIVLGTATLKAEIIAIIEAASGG